MIRFLVLALGGACLAGAVLAQEAAGDRQAGRVLAGQCRTCHGLDGKARIPVAPNIGGESAAYIARQLAAFRDGSRQSEMMSVVAASLSDDQIRDLAAWFAGHRAVAMPPADPAGAPGLCAGCHGADGIAVDADAPNLAGESGIYIETQLKAFRSGARSHETMSEVAAAMTDDEIREAADWYAAVAIAIETVD